MDARNNTCFSAVFLNPDVGKEPQSFFSHFYTSPIFLKTKEACDKVINEDYQW